MALELKRITWPYDCVKCDITRKLIAYGEYYYEDDEDGFIVDAEYYHQRKMADKYEQALQNPELYAGQDAISYQAQMRAAERKLLDRGLLERPVVGKPYIPKGGIK